MISHIIIKNYALIDKLEITFNEGFTVITGETGSGKSILISSLKYLLKIEPTLFHDKTKKIIIEGQFKIDQPEVKNIFNNYNIDFHTETIIRESSAMRGAQDLSLTIHQSKLNPLKTYIHLL